MLIGGPAAFGRALAAFRGGRRGRRRGGAARAEVPVEQRQAVRAVIAETDPRRQLEPYAATQPGIRARTGPLVGVLADAAGEPGLAELRSQPEDQRLSDMARFAPLLAGRQALRLGCPPPGRATCCGPSTHTTFMAGSSCNAAGRRIAAGAGSPSR